MISQKVRMHPGIMFANQVVDICKPLEKIDVDFFAHVRTIEDGSLSMLCNRPDIAIACAESQLYHNAKYTKHPRYYTSGFYLWNNDIRTEHEEMHSQLLQTLGISNGMTIIRKEATHCDFFHFATSPANAHINHFYVNNLDTFSRFADFFLEKAYQLIMLSEKCRIHILPENQDLANLIGSEDSQLDGLFSRNFLEANIIEESIKLSKRQKECLYWLLRGKTASEIAEVLQLSRRTIETYINHIKVKFHCNSKTELVVKGLKFITKENEMAY